MTFLARLVLQAVAILPSDIPTCLQPALPSFASSLGVIKVYILVQGGVLVCVV